MVEYKELDLNINEVSRMEQQIEVKNQSFFNWIIAGIGILMFGGFLLLISGGDSDILKWTLILPFGPWIYSVRYYIERDELKAKYEALSNEDKENNSMVKIAFKSVEKTIDELVVSKTIEFQPSYREKNYPKDHKILLDHENRNLYFIVLDNTDKKECIEYCKVPYAEIIQAAVVIDDNIVSKSSLASKVGGTLAGGVLAGGVGAIVGGVNTKKTNKKEINTIELLIVVNHKEKPLITMRINELPLKKEEKIKEVKTIAEEWKATLDVIIREENTNLPVTSQVEKQETISKSKTDQKEKIQMLKDLAELKSSGSISEEDYNKLKEEILDN